MSNPSIPFQKILCPVLTEKSMRIEQYGQYVFKVAITATKREIKSAIETYFSVVVSHVHVVQVKRKNRNARPKKAWKKAYIKLAPGGVITLNKVDVK